MRACGAVCLVVFISTKSPYALKALCSGGDWGLDYGNLYRETKVRRFKIRVADQVGQEPEATDKASLMRYPVVLMGDSFAAYHRGHENLSAALERSLGAPVFTAGWDVRSPLCLFDGGPARAGLGGPSLVVLETTELSLLERLENPAGCRSDRRAPVSWTASLSSKLYDRVFFNAEIKHRFVLYNSVLTAPAIEAWNSLMFSAFRVLPGDVKFSLDPPLLFSREETILGLKSSYFYPHPDPLVRRVASRVAEIRDRLERDHHARLIFMPIPGKYTIYHRFAGTKDYDEFLPRLYAELDRQGVETVKLYEPYRRFPGMVYMPTDSHWNADGARIALEETLRVIARRPFRRQTRSK